MSVVTKKKTSTIARLPDVIGEGSAPKVSDRERDAALLALIKKGGRSARPEEDLEEEKIPEKRISLRIPEDIAERVKQAAQARPVKTPSHTWIVEAILEKLKKEGF